MEYINCTTVTITVPGLGTFAPSGINVRCKTLDQQITPNGVIPRLVRRKLGNVVGLPGPANRTIYIVSNMVLQALVGSRLDVVAPDTGATVSRRSEPVTTLVVPGFLVY